ncbi:MAG TPA: 2-amino-4-hydroxy-6-hydroxymethyldihydropteridine diphosphokinase [Planctomycetota bacterium]|nr:2-amino-4-hydroxy-6-hydroxymethyldihydropteridine diphosphokinase [Planctomycetota bacterium]
MTRVYVGLGSNLGDRAARIYGGLRGCVEHGLRLHDLSPLYETEAADGAPAQPLFLNAVAALETGLAPGVVLRILQLVEESEGRERPARNAPRTLDLDLLLHGSTALRTESLVLPHPRMTERRFVLEPLADLAPDLVIPGGDRTVAELLDALVEREGPRAAAVRRFAPA